MIDLHAHTTVSDGTVTPRELIQLAKEAGLKAIAITDHDSIDGHDEAQEEADRLGIDLVKGIEFSTTYGDGRLIHILGLGIDPDCDGFMSLYKAYKEERASKLAPVFKRLQEVGVEVTAKDVLPYVLEGYMDRQAIAKYLVAKGYAKIMKYAWVNYLDHIPYVDGELIKPEVAIEAIHAAGGKAFMAHYHLPIGLKGYSEVEANRRLKELKQMGLDGLEYYYPSFTEEDQYKCGQYIKKYNFLKSGGTDFHGSNRPHIKLGVGEGDFKVPDYLLESILDDDSESASA